MEEPNVKAFCRALRKCGVKLLDFPDPDLRQLAEFQIGFTDLCFSDNIAGSLESVWDDGVERSVEEALESFLYEVRDQLDRLLGPSSLFPWGRTEISKDRRDELCFLVDYIQLVHESKSIATLIAAANTPLSPDEVESPDSPLNPDGDSNPPLSSS